MCGKPNPNRDYWATIYIPLGMMDHVLVRYINVTQRGGLYIDNFSDGPSEKHDFQEIKQALNNPKDKFSPMIKVEVQGENKYYGKDIKPNKNAINRFNKLIQNTAYEVVKQRGTSFILEQKDKDYYTCHCCNAPFYMYEGKKDPHDIF